jgi:hypothetical protein
MAMRAAAGGDVAASDLGIQLAALAVFAGLLWWDRNGPARGDPPR